MKFFIFGCVVLCVLCNVLCQEANFENDQNVNEISNSISNEVVEAKSTTLAEPLPSPKPTTTSKPVAKPPRLVCPGKDTPRPFFALPCKVPKECSVLGKGMLCCTGRCLKGVPPPKPEPLHSPTLFGLVERICPTEPLPELMEIRECTTDSDCGSRICCPEKMLDGSLVGFCRTAQPMFDRIPGARRFVEPMKTIMSYMQCTPPPPPLLDVFPKVCSNPLDCFPNLCCQERGKRFCRPPKRSLLALVTSVAQRLVPAQTARDFINRIAS